jgi:sugar phosphate isomerase/epimerase
MKLSRRDLFASAALGPLAYRLSAANRAIPIGLELYSVRDELVKDLPGTVTKVARMGYKVVEFYSPYYDWTLDYAKDVRKLMNDLGIECRSTHNGSKSFSAEGIQKAIDLNQTIGSKYIVMASPGSVKDLDGWKRVAEQLSAAADRLKPLGMFAGYHNHKSEFVPMEGKRPMEVIAANTPANVALQCDVGTVIEAGSDPVAWIEAHPGRIRSMHLKDWTAREGEGFKVLLGEGDAPWAKILDAAEKVGGVEYYLIEQEGSRFNSIETAERCLAALKKMRV